VHTIPAFTGADLIFSPELHEYRLPLTGDVVPSVTQVLRDVGVSTDFEGLKASSKWLADRIDHKRDLGTAVHADAHAYDDDDLDWSTVHPEVKPYLDAWVTFRENQHVFPLQRERRLYSPSLRVCGTMDGVFYRAGDPSKRILIDIKCGDPDAAAAQFQTAGYQLLWEEERPELPIAERWSVQLTPDLSVPYRITNYSTKPDAYRHGQLFRSFVATYYAQAARRHR
jgi:hypothetical protein